MRYPLVETLTGALFLLAWLQYGGTAPWTAALVAVFLAALVAITYIDWDLRIIPDRITKPGMVVFVALAPLNGLHAVAWVHGKPEMSAWVDAFVGLAVGAGVVLAIRLVGSWVLRKEAMGLGDVKLMGLIGAAVGPVPALYALALGCFAGALIGGVLFLVGRRRALPCALVVRGPGGEEHAFDRLRLRDGRLAVAGGEGLEAGAGVRLDLTLSAARILEDEDARIALRGRVVSAEGEGARRRVGIEVEPPRAADAERLEMFRTSYRYIPFGPFLALGGALTALYAGGVHWAVTEWYPRFARSLLG
jgi:leader peptidase (prepilin peptidase)/N-methyltransferase